MPLTPSTIRTDKKCGDSGIPDNAKCSKGTSPSVGVVENSSKKLKKAKSKRPNLIGVLGSSIQLGNAAYNAYNFGRLYQQSGGHAAYGIATAGQVASGVLAGLGLSENLKGNSGRGALYSLGSYGTSVGSIFGAQAYAEHERRQREQRKKTGYTGSDPFEDLGIREGASAAEIRRAFIKKAQTAHPDRGGSAEEMAKINSAYQEALRRTGGSPRGRSARTSARGVSGPRLLKRGDSVWANGFDLWY